MGDGLGESPLDGPGDGLGESALDGLGDGLGWVGGGCRYTHAAAHQVLQLVARSALRNG